MHDLTADLVVSFSLSHINSLACSASLLLLTSAIPPRDQGRIGNGVVGGLHQEGVRPVDGISSNSPASLRDGDGLGIGSPVH